MRRAPPAYQRYAADILGSEAGALLTLEARGLLASIQDAAWQSKDCSVPADPGDLAMVVRRPIEEVRRALPTILDRFDASSPGRLVVAELREQMEGMMARRAQLAEAGRKGGAAKHSLSHSSSSDSGSGSSGGSLSTEQLRTAQQSQLVGAGKVDDSFVHAYEAAEQVAPRRRFVAVPSPARGQAATGGGK